MAITYNDIFTSEGLNTLAFIDPFAKISFIGSVISQYQNISFLDLDTTFTAYFNAGLFDGIIKQYSLNYQNCNKIRIYLPGENRFEILLKEVIRSMHGKSIVIIDSINSFFTLYYSLLKIQSGQGLGVINHLLYTLLMILVKQGRNLGIPVLATYMLRYGKGIEWNRDASSKRIIHSKSLVRLYAEIESSKFISLDILSHPTLPPQNLKIQFTELKI